jgi:uncharacterized SAM-binding protein YcdF (DUF218 family)
MPYFRKGGADQLSTQAIATSLLLPPFLLVVVSLAAVILFRRRLAAWLVALCAIGQLLLGTPFVAGQLRASLESQIPETPMPGPSLLPQAIIVLSAEGARRRDGYEPGPLTLERLHAGARLARRTGLPLLVTGGPLAAGAPPIAQVMAGVLSAEFGLPVRWIEAAAHDTRENAVLSAAMLRADGIMAAYLVTHAWHMPRSLDAFARTGFPVLPAPVALSPRPDGRVTDWIPRPDHLAQSWFMLREWAGILVYRLRDGPVPQRQ